MTPSRLVPATDPNAVRIVAALAWIPEDQRGFVIEHLQPWIRRKVKELYS